MRNRRIARCVAVAVVCAIAIGSCGDGSDESVSVDSPPPSDAQDTGDADGGDGEVFPCGGRLQAIVDGALDGNEARAFSMAVMVPGYDTWTGVAGWSEPKIRVTPEMAFGIASTSKNFVAALVLQLAEEGKLSLDDPVHRWLAADASVDDAVTVRQLLNHTSGIFTINRHPDYWAAVFGDPHHDWTDEELLARFLAEPVAAAGTEWHYSNTGYLLLGQIIESVTGSTVSAELRARFFEPLGLDTAFYLSEEDPPGEVAEGWFDISDIVPDVDPAPGVLERFSDYPWVATMPEAGGVFASPRDLAAWARALYHDGDVLRPDTLTEMLEFEPIDPASEEAQLIAGYGLGALTFRAELFGGTTVIGHSGGGPFYSAVSAYLPEHGIAIGAAQSADGNDQFGEALAQAVAVVTDPEVCQRPGTGGDPSTTPVPSPTQDDPESAPQATAFVGAAVVPMTADVVLSGQTVLVEGDRIASIGPVGEVELPEGTLVVDAQGAYLMPGLADMHVHLDDVWPVPMLDLFLANGVTTVRNLNGWDPSVLTWRDDVAAGTLRGPSIYTAGPTIYEDAPDLEAVVMDQLDQGYDLIKVYSYLSREGLDEVIAAAHERGGYVVGHVPYAVGLEAAVAMGLDEIAHVEELTFELIEFDRTADLPIGDWLPYIFEQANAELRSSAPDELLGERIAKVIDTLRDADVPVDTTVFLSELIVEKLTDPDAFLRRPELEYMPADYLAEFDAGSEEHQVQFAGHEDIAAVRSSAVLMLLEALHEADVQLVLGTDAGTGSMGLVPGFTIHDELAVLTANGLTPYEAILTGTANASSVVEAMTGTDDFGTIEIGKRADLLLIGENPLEDISHIDDQLLGVMAAGHWHTTAELTDMITLDI